MTSEPSEERAEGFVGPLRAEMTPTIQSVERAARILNFFTVSRPRLSLTEITARLGMSKATAHRYAMALRQVNLLRYDPAAAEYTLGPQVLVLAAAARAGLPIIGIAGPIMEELVREVNETVVLSVWEGEAPVVVRVDDGTERIIRVSVRAGSRLSPFESAQGRVFCAFLPEGSVAGLEDELARSPRLKSDLDAIRETGLAVNFPNVHGVRTIAAPVFGASRIVAVVALVGTTATLSDDLASPAAKALQRAAKKLSELHGMEQAAGEVVELGRAAAGGRTDVDRDVDRR
ncbi:MAG TPA: IclR family transcriptional regulator [Acidimicrobiales bacterium]|jgi:DNA-binding IclR family transcriptional regulator|nr:IclR family transcriptional regulator [Acidimicrobiales bacterium]